jgi:hypothetical protein
MEDRSIRVSGGSGLFYFTVLCSYTNFRTSYKRIGGINYTVYPGEWVCKLDEITKWFRARFHWQAVSILNKLQEQNLITYTRLGRGKVIKFRIKDWRYFNTIIDYNAPCQKDTGFFFLPISKAAEVISTERCSEMDIVLDLWMNTVYNDEQVQGSEVNPVVYIRNGTGSPLIGYADLALRWGQSKATVGRVLKKLEQLEYLSLLTFPGRHGSVICMKNYLSTMFQISDIMIDKDEIAMSLSINISVPDDDGTATEKPFDDTPISVSNGEIIVSNPNTKAIIDKIAETLAASGLSCCVCPKSRYMLSRLSPDCREGNYPISALREGQVTPGERYTLEVICDGTNKTFLFEINFIPIENKSLERKTP